MNRRTFVTVLATLCAWPLTRLRAHENAVKAIPKPGKPVDWHPSHDGKVLVKVWDNYSRVRDYEPRFVRSAYLPGPCQRRLAFNPRAAGGVTHVSLKDLQPDSTIFRMVAEDHLTEANGLTHTTLHYDYESGPKWWAVSRFDEARWDDEAQ